MTTQILDVYHGNKFDAGQEKATGTNAVLIKGGQGEFQDYLESHCNYIEQCDRAGLPLGIYWQIDARYSPEKHKAAIKDFDEAIGFGDLGLWLACEKPFYPCPDFLYSRMPYAFYKPIESIWRGITQSTGVPPGIYTSLGMWRLIFNQCPLPLQQEFAEKSKLWVAQYKVSKPSQIGQWPNYHFWQYQAEPDYSVFNGTDASFQFQYGGQYIPEPPPPVEDPANGGTGNADNGDTALLVRTAVLDEAIHAIEALK